LAGLALAGVRTELRPAHPAAGPEGLDQAVDLLDEADRRPRERGDMSEVELVGQRPDVRAGRV
jgi:hypothetical protein